MGPGPVVEFPDSRVGFVPPQGDGIGRDLSGPPAVCVQAVVPVGGGEQEQCLAEDVQLELLVDPVADPVVAAWVAAQPEGALVGDQATGDGVRGCRVRTVLMQARRDELHCVVQQGWGPAAATA